MIKIERVEEIHNTKAVYPRIMKNDLDQDNLVIALFEEIIDSVVYIKFITLNSLYEVIEAVESHHLQDFEGSITIRNER